MKKKVLIVSALIIMISLSVFGCSSGGAKKAVSDYFGALKKLDFKAASAFFGDSSAYDALTEAYTKTYDTYFEEISTKSFLEFFYKNLSYKIVSSEEDANITYVKIDLTSYKVEDILAQVQRKLDALMDSQTYKNAGSTQKYVLLCEAVPDIYENMKDDIAAQTQSIIIRVEKRESAYYILPDKTLFDALAGG